MNYSLKTLVAAATIGSAALAVSAPARADNFSISIGVGAIGFSYSSGGYCDAWGCMDDYWNYPVYYCPVYYRGHWYSGPVYYRYTRGDYWYWIHGGWRRESSYRSRPSWACQDRYGPPLDLDFYIWNGFYVRDDWRWSWYRNRNSWWRHRHDWDNSHHGRDNDNWHNWVPQQQRSYDFSRQNNWNKDRDWTRKDWQPPRQINEIRREHKVPVIPVTQPDNNRPDNNRPDNNTRPDRPDRGDVMNRPGNNQNDNNPDNNRPGRDRPDVNNRGNDNNPGNDKPKVDRGDRTNDRGNDAGDNKPKFDRGDRTNDTGNDKPKVDRSERTNERTNDAPKHERETPPANNPPPVTNMPPANDNPPADKPDRGNRDNSDRGNNDRGNNDRGKNRDDSDRPHRDRNDPG